MEKLGNKFAEYDLALLGILDAIADQDKNGVKLLITLLQDMHCHTPEQTVQFLTWMMAQHSVLYFELLTRFDLTVQDDAFNRQVEGVTMAAEMDNEQTS